MPYVKQVLLTDTSLDSPFYVCIFTLLLSLNECTVSLYKLALDVCPCGMQRVRMTFNIRIFRADDISYFMDFKSLKTVVAQNRKLPIAFPNHTRKIE